MNSQNTPKRNTKKGFAVISSHCEFLSPLLKKTQKRPTASTDNILMKNVLERFGFEIETKTDKTKEYYEKDVFEKGKLF